MVSSGTGKAAQIGEFAAGKTGTTENYGDAWFVGFNEELTVAVWVGYRTGSQPMETEYHGEPVAGGTFPAEIWHDFMLACDRRSATSGARTQGKDAERRRRDHDRARGARPSTAHRRPSTTPEDGRRRRRAPRPAAAGAAAARRPRPRPTAAGARPDGPAPETPAPARRRPRPRPSPAAAAGTAARRARLGGAAAPHGRRPRPRHVAAVGVAEAPGQLDGLRDADPRRRSTMRGARAGRPRQDLDRPVEQRGAVQLEPDPERLGQLARARAEVLDALEAARAPRISSMPSTGSSARIRTAAPSPSGSATKFSSAWMPYER